ncbi:pimeloyl-ACP methyl ester carboxylesterase [Actinomadura rupiterrae]|nr:alpha/beta fold hydrolase [Actinomadura rupiterrae]MCP2335200.1 pimeloyl-ACP methyl ester carboxylesterase [Actinomadura rupiterrae]
MGLVRHRTAIVDGHEIFYREAGPADAPAIVLLHGYPTSSFMFRHLIPLLAGDYHVIAPDHLGFGLSDAPAVEEFAYTFDALADLTAGLLDRLGLDRYALYVQDYGAPIGWRLALEHPERISAVVTQNGNGYEDGFVESFWADVWAYGADPGPRTEPASAPRSASTPSAGSTCTASPTRAWSARTPGSTTSRSSHVRATTRSSWRCFATTRTTGRSTRACTGSCAPARSRCSPCGAATTRSSGRRARRPSLATPPMPKST